MSQKRESIICSHLGLQHCRKCAYLCCKRFGTKGPNSFLHHTPLKRNVMQNKLINKKKWRMSLSKFWHCGQFVLGGQLPTRAARVYSCDDVQNIRNIYLLLHSSAFTDCHMDRTVKRLSPSPASLLYCWACCTKQAWPATLMISDVWMSSRR